MTDKLHPRVRYQMEQWLPRARLRLTWCEARLWAMKEKDHSGSLNDGLFRSLLALIRSLETEDVVADFEELFTSQIVMESFFMPEIENAGRIFFRDEKKPYRSTPYKKWGERRCEGCHRYFKDDELRVREEAADAGRTPAKRVWHAACFAHAFIRGGGLLPEIERCSLCGGSGLVYPGVVEGFYSPLEAAFVGPAEMRPCPECGYA